MKCEMANSNSSTDFDVRLYFIFCGILFPQWRVNSVKNAKGFIYCSLTNLCIFIKLGKV